MAKKNKMKTRKSIAKRFKLTKNGKVLYNKMGRRHILTKKYAKRKRQLRKVGVLSEVEAKKIKKLLPKR